MNNETGGNLAGQAVTRFWERMESRAQPIIDLAADPAENRERDEKKLWRKKVMELYDDSCPCETARQMTAWVEAKPNFNRKKGKYKNGK